MLDFIKPKTGTVITPRYQTSQHGQPADISWSCADITISLHVSKNFTVPCISICWKEKKKILCFCLKLFTLVNFVHCSRSTLYLKVLESCDQIPKYTAVATFVSGNYPIGQGRAGVLTKCLPDGFQVN